ncbi:acetate/propionate family kinase [Catenovulum sediminis]|uniref:acetate/propionate family kinase n=1 Tax=Catenovulum sediminis TaxID=1740262 RepID=UPI00163D546E|nr:acetate/propionate family kinase [Catenovulum sediminis]
MPNQNVLVINCGSASLRFSVFANGCGEPLICGNAENLEKEKAYIKWKVTLQNEPVIVHKEQMAGADHKKILNTIFALLNSYGFLEKLSLIGHKVTHGGEHFSKPVVLNDKIIKTLNQISNLAPLHNPANITGIKLARKNLPNVMQVAVFDTGFHQSMPAHAYLYGLPVKYHTEYGVRRYGFHGISHQYASEKAAEFLGLQNEHGIISVHLDHGSSVCAINNGRSVDTSMGFTPLEGLVMGTRCGDIDASIVDYLNLKIGMPVADITRLLNKGCGLLGLSGISDDIRVLVDHAHKGNADAQLAIEIFCYRVAKYITSYIASIERLDAIVFTGKIGESENLIRDKIISRLAVLGIKVNTQENTKRGDKIRLLSSDSQASRCQLVLVPVAEELQIAKQCKMLVS